MHMWINLHILVECLEQNGYIIYNLIKIRCFYPLFSLVILTSNNIPYGVTSGFIFSTNQSAMSLLNCLVSNVRAVVWLVNILNCLDYDHNWEIKDVRKVTWSDPKRDVVRCLVVCHQGNKKFKKDTTNIKYLIR